MAVPPFNIPDATRAWLYRLFLAAAAIAVFYNVVTGEEAALWAAAVSAFLGNGLATSNTSTKG